MGTRTRERIEAAIQWAIAAGWLGMTVAFLVF
jgi:hypothetical protein